MMMHTDSFQHRAQKEVRVEFVPELMKQQERVSGYSMLIHCTTMSIPATSALPFELRVHALESRIYGPQQNGASSSSSTSSNQRSIQGRIRDIEETLDRAAQSSEALKRLLDGCTSSHVHETAQLMARPSVPSPPLA